MKIIMSESNNSRIQKYESSGNEWRMTQVRKGKHVSDVFETFQCERRASSVFGARWCMARGIAAQKNRMHMRGALSLHCQKQRTYYAGQIWFRQLSCESLHLRNMEPHSTIETVERQARWHVKPHGMEQHTAESHWSHPLALRPSAIRVCISHINWAPQKKNPQNTKPMQHSTVTDNGALKSKSDTFIEFTACV